MVRNRTLTRGAVVLAALGLVAGALIAGPAGAAFNPTKAKIKKIAKKEATKVFNGAIGAAIAGKQDKCQPGSVLGFVSVDASAVTTGATYTADGLTARYNCKDPAQANTITARNVGGFFRIRFAGVTDVVPTTTRYVALATISENILDQGTITAFPFNVDGQFVVDVYMEDGAGQAQFDFNVALLGYSGLAGTTGRSLLEATSADGATQGVPEEIGAAGG
jgi:hypothetical protein